MSRNKLFIVLIVWGLLFSLSACSLNIPVDDIMSDLENMGVTEKPSTQESEYEDDIISNSEGSEFTEKPTAQAPKYENVSRPIKEFWIIRGGILALTETNELYYGLADTANPVLITSNVKEIIISEDGYTGLILLNNGKIIKVNNRGPADDSIYIHEFLTETPDCTEATYNVSAEKLFDENLFTDAQGNLKDLEGNIIYDKAIKEGYVMNYSTNAGVRFNGLFLLEDGTVVHRFAEYEEPKDRIITTDAARLDIFVLTTRNTCFGSVIRNNGDLLTWVLDEYAYETDPLSPISKVASNANPDFASISYGNLVYYVDTNNNLCCWDEEKSTTEILKNGVTQIYYNDVDLHTDGMTDADDRIFVVDESNELYSVGLQETMFTNVKELIGNGFFANYLDNRCSRFNGKYGETYRTSNVKQALVSEVSGSGDVLQVFLKYGGALYAANGNDANIYKTSFCETTTNLRVNGSLVLLRQAIQSQNGAYMLPYDELCTILNLTPMEDKTTNGIIIESGTTKVEFVIGKTTYKLNGTDQKTTVAPYKDSDGLVWIPIEVVATNFNMQYSVESSDSSIYINITN